MGNFKAVKDLGIGRQAPAPILEVIASRLEQKGRKLAMVIAARNQEWTIRVLIALSSLAVGMAGTAFWIKGDVAQAAQAIAVNSEQIIAISRRMEQEQEQTDRRIERMSGLVEKLIEQNTVLIAKLGANRG